jgi:hypothetical protein
MYEVPALALLMATAPPARAAAAAELSGATGRATAYAQRKVAATVLMIKKRSIGRMRRFARALPMPADTCSPVEFMAVTKRHACIPWYRLKSL